MGTDKRARQKANRQARIEAAEAEAAKEKNRARFTRFAVIGGVILAIIVLFAVLSGGDDDDADDGSVITDDAATAEADEPASDEGAAPADDVPVDSSGFAYGTGECPPEEGVDSPIIDFDGPFQQCIEPGGTYVATFDTTVGEIVVNLDTTNTPGTANNFISLARNGYYDGTEIFRSNTNIGIFQGGGPHTQTNADPGPGYTIPDEGGPYTYEPGQLVMARTGAPNSASAQFFFAVNELTAGLDSQGTYVVFGNAATDADLQVLEDILAMHEGDADPSEGRPAPTVVVNSVTITEG